MRQKVIPPAQQDNSSPVVEPTLDFLQLSPTSRLPMSSEEIAEKIKTSNPEELYQLANAQYEAVFYNQAFLLYQAAAATKHIEAINKLGDCYYFGHGVTENKDQAIKCYQFTADNNSLYGKYRMGACAYSGYGMPKNPQLAMTYFQAVANTAHPNAFDAQRYIGYIYYNAKDYQHAFPYLRASADQGHSQAQACIGEMLYKGEGVRKDRTLSASYFKKSAAQLNSDSLNWIGWILLRRVKDSDVVKGLWCCVLAEQLGSEGAVEKLGRLLDIQRYGGKIRLFRDQVQQSVENKKLEFTQQRKSLDIEAINKEAAKNYLARALPTENDNLEDESTCCLL